MVNGFRNWAWLMDKCILPGERRTRNAAWVLNEWPGGLVIIGLWNDNWCSIGIIGYQMEGSIRSRIIRVCSTSMSGNFILRLTRNKKLNLSYFRYLLQFPVQFEISGRYYTLLLHRRIHMKITVQGIEVRFKIQKDSILNLLYSGRSFSALLSPESWDDYIIWWACQLQRTNHRDTTRNHLLRSYVLTFRESNNSQEGGILFRRSVWSQCSKIYYRWNVVVFYTRWTLRWKDLQRIHILKSSGKISQPWL